MRAQMLADATQAVEEEFALIYGKRCSTETARRLADCAVSAAQFWPMGDNHHNAALCPYCGPNMTSTLKAERAKTLKNVLKLLEDRAAKYRDTGTGTDKLRREGAMIVYDDIDQLLQQEGA